MKKWEHLHQTVGLLVREPEHPDEEPQLLVGEPESGPLKGMVIPPGGKMNDEDRKAEWVLRRRRRHCCRREVREETGLITHGERLVAYLTVRFLKERCTRHVYVFRCDWSGTLQQCAGFRNPRFVPFSELPKLPLPEHDEVWLPYALRFQDRRVFIECDSNRRDVKSFYHRQLAPYDLGR